MKLYKFVISALNFYIFLNSVSSKSVNDVVTMAIEELRPHHLVFWKKLNLSNDQKKIYASNLQLQSILKKVMKIVPTTLIDLNNPPPFAYFNRSMLRNNNVIYEYNINISAPLHIIFFDDKVADLNLSLTHLLEKISDSVMYLSTPKCLFVLNQRNNSFSPIKDILTIARNFQFVDFTLIQAIPNKSPVLFYYNVSTSSIEMRMNFTLNLKMFPDKLKNMNGYNLHVRVNKYFWPSHYKRNYGLPMHLCPLLQVFKFYEHFAVSLNVTSIYVPVAMVNNFYNKSGKDIEMALDAYTIAHDTLSFTNVYIREYNMFVAVVPLIHEVKINVPVKMLFSLFCIFGTIISILLFLKDSSSEWSILLIFQLMLGQTANFQPLSKRSKLVYGILLFFSVFVISDLVTDLTSIGFEINEGLLASSIDDVFQKNLSVVSQISTKFLDLIAFSSHENTKKLFSSCKFTNADCYVNENEIYISIEHYGKVCLYKSLVNGTNNFTLVDMDLPILVFAYNFKKLSPFRIEFGEIENRILEFGLDIKWARDLKVVKPIEKDIEIDTNKKFLIINLICILLIGISLSFVALIFELVWHHVAKKIESKRSKSNKSRNIIKIEVECRNDETEELEEIEEIEEVEDMEQIEVLEEIKEIEEVEEMEEIKVLGERTNKVEVKVIIERVEEIEDEDIEEIELI